MNQTPDNAEHPRIFLHDALKGVDLREESREAYAMIEALYPICRSITGNGVRQSLRLLQGTIPLEVREVPTGTQAFDWTVPKEWNIRDAYIKNDAGDRVFDFQTMQSACAELQHPGAPKDVAHRTQTPPLHIA